MIGNLLRVSCDQRYWLIRRPPFHREHLSHCRRRAWIGAETVKRLGGISDNAMVTEGGDRGRDIAGVEGRPVTRTLIMRADRVTTTSLRLERRELASQRLVVSVPENVVGLHQLVDLARTS